MSQLKEPRFFAFADQPPNFKGPGDEDINRETITDAKAYEALFAGAQGQPAIGEVSPIYLYSEVAPRRIANFLPDARLIAMLRDPCERAFSHFRQNRQHRAEPERDFATALAREDERVAAGWGPRYHYARWGFYHQQVSRYFDLFPRDHIRIYKYEDFAAHPLGTLKDICKFLEIDPTFDFGTPRRYNAPLSRRTRLLNRLRVPPKVRQRIGRYARGKRQKSDSMRSPIPAKVRDSLAETFTEDARTLARLLDWDISDWHLA